MAGRSSFRYGGYKRSLYSLNPREIEEARMAIEALGNSLTILLREAFEDSTIRAMHEQADTLRRLGITSFDDVISFFKAHG